MCMIIVRTDNFKPKIDQTDYFQLVNQTEGVWSVTESSVTNQSWLQ